MATQDFKLRTEFNKAIFMYKVNNNDVPEYICNMYKRQDPEMDRYNLRSNDKTNFYIPMPHVEIFKVGMIYSGSVLWNNLPITLKSTKSISAFKKHYENKFLSDTFIH